MLNLTQRLLQWKVKVKSMAGIMLEWPMKRKAWSWFLCQMNLLETKLMTHARADRPKLRGWRRHGRA